MTEENVRVPKWAVVSLAGFALTMMGGAVAQAVIVYAKLGVVEFQVQTLAAQQGAINTKLDALQISMSDRWTGSQHAEYSRSHAAEVSARFSSLEDRVSRHEAKPGHDTGMARVNELERRVRELEEDVDRIRSKEGR